MKDLPPYQQQNQTLNQQSDDDYEEGFEEAVDDGANEKERLQRAILRENNKAQKYH